MPVYIKYKHMSVCAYVNEKRKGGATMPRKVYGIENLDCAACAAKLEREIQKIPGVEEVTIIFATEQLRVTAEDPDALLPEIRRVAAEMEPDVTVSERKDRSGHHEHHAHHHHEKGECGCGHEHHHHDDDEDECCGHDHHHHHHDHDHGGCCGHDHEDEEVRESQPLMGKGVTIYTVENLDCAACAAKLESRLRTVEGVEDLTITYATKQLRIRAKDPAALLPELRRVAVSMEPDVEILEEAARGKTARERGKAGACVPLRRGPAVYPGRDLQEYRSYARQPVRLRPRVHCGLCAAGLGSGPHRPAEPYKGPAL